MRHFRTQNGPFASSTAFLGMTINTIFIYLLPHIYCPNFKKNFYADPGFWCTILGSKMTHLLKQEFLSENPLKSIVPLIHAYLLKVRYQSINKMLMIKEYWNLIGRDPFLAITWELDVSQACSFCRMLMDYKNFRLTPIPGKTNDLIFLKSPKNLVLGKFWLFLPNELFFFFWKNPARPLTTIYGSLTLTYLQTDRRTDEP